MSVQSQFAALSAEDRNALLSQLLGSVAPEGVTVEYHGPGGISASTAKRVRAGLYERIYDNQQTIQLATGPKAVVTLEMLATTKRWTTARPSDGKKGNHYYLVDELSEENGKALADWLESHPAKPKQQKSFGGNRQQSAPQSDPRLDRLEALVMQLIEGQFQQPAAQPVTPVAGHTIGAPAFVEPEAEIVELSPGQPVLVNGELRYVSDDGKRLNKTAAE